MKRFLVAGVLGCALTSVAHATPIGDSKPFGLGITAFDPIGVSMKFYIVPPDGALELAVTTPIGLVCCDIGDFTAERLGFLEAIHIRLAYEHALLTLVDEIAFDMNFYGGIGGFTTIPITGGEAFPRSVLGVRVPLGVSFDFEDPSLQIFAGISGGTSVFPASLRIGITIDMGVRYYF